MKIYRCDNCGKFNPKILKGANSYTDCCKYPDRNSSAGKRTRVYLQFPIKWVGFISWYKSQKQL